MNSNKLIHAVFDVLVRNNKGNIHEEIADMQAYIDSNRDTIVFTMDNGLEIELRAVATYAPSEQVTKG